MQNIQSIISKIVAIVLLSSISAVAAAQDAPKVSKGDFSASKDAWKSVKKGNKYYKKGRPGAYFMALEYYKKALETNDVCSPLLYRVGVCEVFTGHDKQAMRHLADAADLSMQAPKDCEYWLAVSKQHMGLFDDARRDFDDCLMMMDSKTKKSLNADIDLRMAQCDNGIRLAKAHDMSVVMHMEGAINSNMPEYAPVFSNLDSAIYFGTQRNVGGVSKKLGKDKFPNSDIFVGFTENGRYTDVRNAGRSLNSKKAEYPAFMDYTGKQMYYTRKDKNVIHTTKKSLNSKWLSGNKYIKRASSVSISEDSSLVIFTARKGREHQGGSDIYFMRRMGKKYSKPQNLGVNVNTKYDEMWASFGTEDTVIYFASNGEHSVGEFDIMKTQFHNGKWNNPVNLGLGINSGADDNYFQLSPGDSRIGYFASKRDGGLGCYDIYTVLLLRKPIVNYPPFPYKGLAADFAKEPILRLEDPEPVQTMRLTVVKGKVSDCADNKSVYSSINVTDNATNMELQAIMTDPETGEYTITLPSGRNYAMTVSSDGYLFHSENFNIPPASKYQEVSKDICMLSMDPGSKIVLNNVFFDTGSSNLSQESHGELERLANIFLVYPGLVIEVSGHTDNLGNRMYNIQLSQQRAEAVRQYLIKLGVQPSQVVAKGYGPDRPCDSNATEAGRKKNRRVEAKILSN